MSTKARWTVVAAALAVSAVVSVALSGRISPSGVSDKAGYGPTDSSSATSRVLKTSPDLLDFGEVLVGEKKTLTLQVENPGTRPVLIYRLILNCSCMGGSVERMTVAPGETVGLPISFTGQPGRRTWSTQASLITDEPGACKYDVPVLGKVQQDFVVEPEVLNFGKVSIGQSPSVQAVVKRRDGEAFSMVAVKAGRPELTFTWDPPSPGNARAYTITAVLKAVRSGTLAELASVITDRGEKVAPAFILAAEVEGDVKSVSGVAVAAWGADRTSLHFDVTLRHKAGTKVKVKDIKESRQAPVRFKEESAAAASDTRLVITFVDRIPSGPPVGEFLLTVEGEGEPFRVPYRIDFPQPQSSGKP